MLLVFYRSSESTVYQSKTFVAKLELGIFTRQTFYKTDMDSWRVSRAARPPRDLAFHSSRPHNSPLILLRVVQTRFQKTYPPCPHVQSGIIESRRRDYLRDRTLHRLIFDDSRQDEASTLLNELVLGLLGDQSFALTKMNLMHLIPLSLVQILSVLSFSLS